MKEETIDVVTIHNIVFCFDSVVCWFVVVRMEDCAGVVVHCFMRLELRSSCHRCLVCLPVCMAEVRDDGAAYRLLLGVMRTRAGYLARP